MAEVLPTGSPEWWLRRLDVALCARAPELKLFSNYYEGEHPLMFATPNFRAAFGGMFRPLSDNWCELVVDAVEERLNVEGFRIPGPETDVTPSGGTPDLTELTTGDTQAWDIWQRNQLDAESQLAHTEALISGESAAIVWWDPDETDKALITVERADQVVVQLEPGGRKRRAALKRWDDEEQRLRFATLYLPDEIYKWQSPYKPGDTYQPDKTKWIPREVADETWPLVNRLGTVPVIPLVNRPRIGRPGRSELANVIPKQDIANKLLADMILASEVGAFRQRWATGLEIPEDPETHQPIEPFKSAVDRLWVSSAPDTTFGEFSESNLAGFVSEIEMIVQHIASQTRTPPHYFYLSGQFPSGEAIKSAETGLVAKARRKMRFFGETWEEVIRLALTVEGRAAPELAKAETIWGDPESRSESQHVDATLKLQSVGIPQEALWEYAGFSPTQIARFRAMAEAEAAKAPAPVSPVQLSVQPPNVNVQPPNVTIPPRPAMTKTLMRDAAGNVLGTQETPTNGQPVGAK